jgi:hypothetical protein
MTTRYELNKVNCIIADKRFTSEDSIYLSISYDGLSNIMTNIKYGLTMILANFTITFR